MNEAVKLSSLAKGRKAVVRRVSGDPMTTRRIREMGVIPGAEVVVEERAPLGDPIEIFILGYHLSLRKDEADSVDVLPL